MSQLFSLYNWKKKCCIHSIHYYFMKNNLLFFFLFFLFKVKCLFSLDCKNYDKVSDRKTLQVLNKRMPSRIQSATLHLDNQLVWAVLRPQAWIASLFYSIYPDHIFSVSFLVLCCMLIFGIMAVSFVESTSTLF